MRADSGIGAGGSDDSSSSVSDGSGKVSCETAFFGLDSALAGVFAFAAVSLAGLLAGFAAAPLLGLLDLPPLGASFAAAALAVSTTLLAIRCTSATIFFAALTFAGALDGLAARLAAATALAGLALFFAGAFFAGPFFTGALFFAGAFFAGPFLAGALFFAGAEIAFLDATFFPGVDDFVFGLRACLSLVMSPASIADLMGRVTVPAMPPSPQLHDEWLWGWDPTPGIVSVWAEPDGRAWVWRRIPGPGGSELVCERERFRPWLILSSLEDLEHLGTRLVPEISLAAEARPPGTVTYQELDGPGELRYLVRADDGRALESAVLRGAGRRLGRSVGSLRYLEESEVLVLPPEEQYLVATGRTYFRDLPFDDLRRAQFDLETTGLSPETSRIFLVAVRDPDGEVSVLEATGEGDAEEAELLRRLVHALAAGDPDIIENHNLHGFDLPFLARRAELLGVSLALGRAGLPGLRQRPAARGSSFEGGPDSAAAAAPSGTAQGTAAPSGPAAASP